MCLITSQEITNDWISVGPDVTNETDGHIRVNVVDLIYNTFARRELTVVIFMIPSF